MSMDTEPSDLIELARDRATRRARERKLIDMHLPLPWLLGGIFSFALLIGGMYFQLNQLSKDMADLKVSVTTGNTASTQMVGDLAVLKWRIEAIERKEGLK